MDRLNMPRKGLILTEGVILAILGTLSLVWPVLSTFGLEMLLGWLLLIGGAVLAFELRHISGWGWLFTNGLLSLIMAGIIGSGWPVSAFWVPGLLFGINLIFSGATLFFFGLKLPCHRCHS